MNTKSATYSRNRAYLSGAGGVFIGAFFLYLRTLAPSTATIFDDSLEFQLVCYQPGIAHPTGYPLYTLLGKLFTLLPVGDVAYRVNLMSAVWGAAAVTVVYLLLWRVTRRILPALGAAASLAVAPIFWSQAVIAEVYTLNALFLAGALWLATNTEGRRPASLLVFVAWYGLSLTHHRTMVLWLPAFALYLWLTAREIIHHPRWLVRLAIAAALPLSLYLYIPLRGMTLTSLDGAYQNSLVGFWTHISGGAYTSFFAENPLAKDFGLRAYGDLLLAQFGAGGGLCALLGFVTTWRAERRAAYVLFTLIFGINSVWVLLYRVPDPEVFTIPSLVIGAVWIGLGINAAIEFAQERRTLPNLVRYAGAALFALVFISSSFAVLSQNYARVDLSHNWEVHDYGVDMLSQPLEEHAALVGLLGEMTLVRYFQQTEGLRPDIQTFVANDEAERLVTVERLVRAGTHVYLTRPLRGVEQQFSLYAVGSLIKVRGEPQITAPQMVNIAARFLPRHERRLVRVTVVWQAPAPLATAALSAEAGDAYQVSARVVNLTGQIVGQHDGIPVHDAYPTTAWRAGEVITDVYDLTIQRGAPPGTYRAQVIMYEPHTQTEIWRGDAAPLELPRDEQYITCPRRRIMDIVRRENIMLCDAEVLTPELRPGEPLRLDLLWQARRAAAEHAAVRVWIESPHQGAQVLAEQMVSPDYPPRLWQSGEVVREDFVHTLPARLPDGDYQVYLRTLPAGDEFALGAVRVVDRARNFTLPPVVHPLNDGVVWANAAHLLGYDVELTNGEMRLALYWQAVGETDVSYTVFVHVVDVTGKIRAQRDSVPGGGALPTSGWVQDEIITDEYVIPRTNLAPGTYNLVVGMYDAATGARAPIFDAASGKSRGDSLTVTSVQIGK